MNALSTNAYLPLARQDTIFNTLKSYGLDPYINAMRNVVCEAPSMQDGAALLSDIYQKFGKKGSVTITYEGKTKLYFDPKSPVDKAPALAYAKQAALPPPNFQKMLNSVKRESALDDEFRNSRDTALKDAKAISATYRGKRRVVLTDMANCYITALQRVGFGYNLDDAFKKLRAQYGKFMPEDDIKRCLFAAYEAFTFHQGGF
jgi:hypothetical protein